MKRISLLLTMLTTLCGNIWATGDEPDETKISTVAEVIAGTDGETFRVKGICRQIESQHGYWSLMDDTGELYIIGTRNKEGEIVEGDNIPTLAEWGIRKGDTITVEGPKTYIKQKDVVELYDVYVKEVKRRDFAIQSVSDNNLPPQGGNVTVTLRNVKGYHVGVVQEIESVDGMKPTWLKYSVTQGTEPVVNIQVPPNEGLMRQHKFYFEARDESSQTQGAIQGATQGLTIIQYGSAFDIPIKGFLTLNPSDSYSYGVTGILTDVKQDSEDGTYFIELSDFSCKMLAKTNLSLKGLEGRIISLAGKKVSKDGVDYMEVADIVLGNKVQEVSLADYRLKNYGNDTYCKITGTVVHATTGYVIIGDGNKKTIGINSCQMGLDPYNTPDWRPYSKSIKVGDQITILRNMQYGWEGEILMKDILISHEKKYTSEDIVDGVNAIVGGKYDLRYDANDDGRVNVADIIAIVNAMQEFTEDADN